MNRIKYYLTQGNSLFEFYLLIAIKSVYIFSSQLIKNFHGSLTLAQGKVLAFGLKPPSQKEEKFSSKSVNTLSFLPSEL